MTYPTELKQQFTLRRQGMSILYLSEIESQINQYFSSQNTMALADSTKAFYRAVNKKNFYLIAK